MPRPREDARGEGITCHLSYPVNGHALPGKAAPQGERGRHRGIDVGAADACDCVNRERHSGVSNYGFFDRLWVGILDLMGVWWLIRRRKRVPEIVEE